MQEKKNVIYLDVSTLSLIPTSEEEALTMFTSNEYEEESGLFLYNAM